MKQKNKRIISVIISMILLFGILGTFSSVYAISLYSSNYSLRQSSLSKTEYEITVKGSVTSSKLTTSTKYAGTAKQLCAYGWAFRTDTDSNGFYRVDYSESEVKGKEKTASVTINASTGIKCRTAVTTHYVETSYDNWDKTYNLTV